MKRVLIALALLVGSAAIFAVALDSQPAAGSSSPIPGKHNHADHRNAKQERYLYVTTLAKSASDPDFIAVIGADPHYADFGRIVDRVDMPKIGDELHHFGYSPDQKRLIVPGLFSSRVHVFDVKGGGKKLRLRAMNEDLVAASGYVVPHGVMAMHGKVLAPMIGAATESTAPGGLVELDDKTGEFVRHFGPGPAREPAGLKPRYMYDFAMLPEANRGISTTFGLPAQCGPGLDPTCLGDEVAVWDTKLEKVIQTVKLGENSGALMVRFVAAPGVRRAFINVPGTSSVWLADDDDHDGVFDFQQVLGPDDGLLIPADLLLSYDGRYMYVTNWFGDTVQQFDISDAFEPKLNSTVTLPHPNMLRLSKDNRRLYVTNSLLSTWDDDTRFGPARNDEYGLWRFDVDQTTGKLSSVTPDGGSWVSFENVQRKNTAGPAGPHMMLFDPSVRLLPGEH
jgi:methanethiol oxidase